MACKGGTVSSGNVLRIVLLGSRGAGKSTLGNALTGRKPPKPDLETKRDEKPTQGFRVGRGMSSETVYCNWARGVRHGTVVEVTDTPGLYGTHLPEEDICREVAKSVAVAKPGPNVIIYVLRCDKRFIPEERAYKKIKQLFSKAMNYFLILVFNGLDYFDDMADTIEKQRKCLDQEIGKFGGAMEDMVNDAGGRYFGMNNKASPADIDRQVKDLIAMMNALVLKNGKDTYYHADMTGKIMEMILV